MFLEPSLRKENKFFLICEPLVLAGDSVERTLAFAWVTLLNIRLWYQYRWSFLFSGKLKNLRGVISRLTSGWGTPQTSKNKIQRLRVIWGQCCLREAAGPCLLNVPITQLGLYVTRNSCTLPRKGRLKNVISLCLMRCCWLHAAAVQTDSKRYHRHRCRDRLPSIDHKQTIDRAKSS